MNREYHYVGPGEIRDAARARSPGTPIHAVEDLRQWLASTPTDRTVEGDWIATFTLGTDQVLRVAPRRSEHVACAAGGPVLSAGEITMDDDGEVVAISNHSTGFCPEPESWGFVEAVLDRLGISHPERFTDAIIFRLCPQCGERNVVKDSWYYCHCCNAQLPESWNFPVPGER